MKEETLNEISESLVNGNFSFNKPKIKRMSKSDLLRLILIYNSMSGEDLEKTLNGFTNYLE